MRITPRTGLAGTAAVAGTILFLLGWFYRSTPLSIASVLMFIALLLLLSYVQYGHLRGLFIKMDGIAERLDDSSREIRSRLDRLQDGQASARLLHEGEASAIASLTDALHVAIRQASDAQGLTLRAFNDLSIDNMKLRRRIDKRISEEMGALMQRLETSSEQFERIGTKIPSETAAVVERNWAPLVESLDKQIQRVRREMEGAKKSVSDFIASEPKLRNVAYRGLASIQFDTMQEIEALMQLRQTLEPRSVTPLLGGIAKGWAMEPVSLLALVTEVLRRKPALVVECGSGASTIWIGLALAKNGHGRLVSLEHLSAYRQPVDDALEEHGLREIAEVRDAPLTPRNFDGESFQWYSPSAIADLEDIDILIVDGPPGSLGPMARYPALRELQGALRSNALVILDDAAREDEQAVITRWRREIAGLGEMRPLGGRLAAMGYVR